MPDPRRLLPRPQVRKFENLPEAIKWSGTTSNTLVGYVNGDLDFVTPGAWHDYIRRLGWKIALNMVVDNINEHGSKAASKIHEQHADAIKNMTIN